MKERACPDVTRDMMLLHISLLADSSSIPIPFGPVLRQAITKPGRTLHIRRTKKTSLRTNAVCFSEGSKPDLISRV
eukprot:1137557-Amphidinium_carterae.1